MKGVGWCGWHVIRSTWRFESNSDGCWATTTIAMALLNFAI